MEESSTFHPIACESCRNKKSKCDREIPICSQCTFAGLSCKYPPINKRGIPSGYISFIEQRLFETELVVLELLSSIYASQAVTELQTLPQESRQILAQFGQKQAKSAKIEEWKALPLSTDEQRHTWWKQRQHLLLERIPTDVNCAPQHSPAHQEAWTDESPMSTPYEDMQPATAAAQPSSHAGQQPHTPTSTWQPPFLNPVVPSSMQELESNDGIHMNPMSSMLGASEHIADISTGALETSEILPSAPVSGTATAERWRKYF